MFNLNILPDNLPAPADDGACNHLKGTRLPAVVLDSTAGRRIDLSKLRGTTVIYCYPMTGRPDQSLPPNWDAIPGARGCTPQACAFRDRYQELLALGVEVYGLSTQTTEYQKEAADRLHLPYELLSDDGQLLTQALQLPTFRVDTRILLKRLTLIVVNGEIKKVFYPVFPPDQNAVDVIVWLKHSIGILPV
jgi:peroxiredoxin